MYIENVLVIVFSMYDTRYFIKIVVSNCIITSCIKFSTMAADKDWKGVPMTHIIGSQSPWGAPEFPLVQPAYNHIVLYHIPGSGAQLDRPPKPQIGKDKWDQEHVRMPFSKHSLYPVVNQGTGETELKSRWEMIQSALNKPIRNTKELANAILSYNTQFKNRWKLPSLYELFDECLDTDETQYFFDVTLPEMVKLALALPKLIQSPIPLLKQHKNRSVSLSQQQISSLLANAFFCTFPRRNTMKKDSEYSSYPSINFNVLYECSPSEHIMEKFKCICHYFRRVCTKVPVGVVTFSRRSVLPRALPDWPGCRRPLADLPLHVDPQQTIEDARGLIQVDFANKYLGGGVLGYGSVQEEIRFMICPELMISMLFTEVLRPNEALMIIGCEQYSKYIGYGHSFQWAGEYIDESPYDSSCRRRCAVLAIDALPFNSKLQEHKKEAITRELNKAWVGFSFFTPDEPGLHYPGVATGNWGCGAFGGTAPLKSLIQMMALAQAGRPMAYYTFGDVKLRDDIIRIYNMLVKHNVTVGELYQLIVEFCNTNVLRTNVFKYLERVLDGRDSTSASQTPVCVTSESMEHNGETDQYELPLTVQMSLKESPDFFGQEEDDVQFVTPTKLSVKQNAEINKDLKQNAEIKKDRNPTHEIGDADCISIEIAETSTTSNQTSRLFNEMEKLDEDSGKLNLKSPQKSIFGHQNKQGESPMDVEDKILTISPDVKKKLARKITDYFSKKPI